MEVKPGQETRKHLGWELSIQLVELVRNSYGNQGLKESEKGAIKNWLVDSAFFFCLKFSILLASTK